MLWCWRCHCKARLHVSARYCKARHCRYCAGFLKSEFENFLLHQDGVCVSTFPTKMSQMDASKLESQTTAHSFLSRPRENAHRTKACQFIRHKRPPLSLYTHILREHSFPSIIPIQVSSSISVLNYFFMRRINKGWNGSFLQRITNASF